MKTFWREGTRLEDTYLDAHAAEEAAVKRVQTTPVLSLILCSRNDQYMGNSRWRLETALNYVAGRVEALGRERDVEVLVADWGSEVPLREVVRLGPTAARIVSFVTVPPALARDLQRDSPFPEVLALNAAARRARGRVHRADRSGHAGRRAIPSVVLRRG